MVTTRVTVLRGGPSSEYEVSMSTGAGVLAALKELGYTVQDVIISKRGEWLVNGVVKKPEVALMVTDVAFIAMHGAYGEDGTVQTILERLHIPFTGSNSFPSRLAFNKDATKRLLREHDIKLPRHVRMTRDAIADTHEIVATLRTSFGPRYVLKPTTSGSSHGVVMIDTPEALTAAIYAMLEEYDECMIEERIIGTEATCGVLEHFRGEELYALPPIENVPIHHR